MNLVLTTRDAHNIIMSVKFNNKDEVMTNMVQMHNQLSQLLILPIVRVMDKMLLRVLIIIIMSLRIAIIKVRVLLGVVELEGDGKKKRKL